MEEQNNQEAIIKTYLEKIDEMVEEFKKELQKIATEIINKKQG